MAGLNKTTEYIKTDQLSNTTQSNQAKQDLGSIEGVKEIKKKLDSTKKRQGKKKGGKKKIRDIFKGRISKKKDKGREL